MVATAIGGNALGTMLAADANLALPQFRNPVAPPGYWQTAAGFLSLLALAFGAAAAVGATDGYWPGESARMPG